MKNTFVNLLILVMLCGCATSRYEAFVLHEEQGKATESNVVNFAQPHPELTSEMHESSQETGQTRRVLVDKRTGNIHYFSSTGQFMTYTPNQKCESTQQAFTPLHQAARDGRMQDIRPLVVSGLNVNAQDETGKTPLHYAAENGHDGTCRMLLECGANPTIRDAQGHTPFEYATMNGHRQTAGVLSESTD